jgi:hypothetical protein
MKTIIAIFFLTIAASVRADTITINILTTRNNGTVTTNSFEITEAKANLLGQPVAAFIRQSINEKAKAARLTAEQDALDAEHSAARERWRAKVIAIESEAQ